MDTFKFSQHTIEVFENDELADIVYQFIKGRNYFMLQRFEKDTLLQKIQTQFPFVVDIQLQREASIGVGMGVESVENDIVDVEPVESEMIESEMIESESVEGETIEGEVVESEVVESEVVEKADASLLWATGNVLGVDVSFAEPLFKVRLGEKAF